MGEVYRARDRRLDRDVAIKVLPDAFVNDPDRLARFEREARVLASLNHSSIGVIHDIQEDRGARFLVLELVEGETLSARLKRGPLPIDEALELMKQVAEALEAAHEKGIFHRDLKPANIQITPAGRAKVLDFGLAKIAQPEAASSGGLSNSPTLGAGNTEGGVILGTAAYMSPEQARGRPVDKRTDIFSFGCVLFETLTGEPAFGGETATDILASVVKGEPDWSKLPGGIPPSARSLLRQCLHKHHNHRLQDIADARIAIEHALTEPSMPENRPIPKAPVWRWAVPAFMVFLLIGAVLGWLVARRPVEAPALAHYQMNVQPAGQLFGSYTVRPSRTAFAMSPDGRLVVFSGRPRTAPPAVQLYARGLAQSEATPIKGTEGGIGPFFSPDGQWIGFFARGQIKKVPVAGGPPVVICDVSDDVGLFGASWSEDGTIFFSISGLGISKVPSGGGTPDIVTTSNAAKGERHLLPQPLPGGKSLIFTVQTANQWDKSQVVLHSLETGQNRVLIDGGADARYVETGHLLYMRMGTLMAMPFDSTTLQLVGDPVALVEGVMQAVSMPNSGDETGAGQFIVSKSGALIYVLGGVHPHGENSVVWVDRKGDEQRMPSVPVQPHLSPRLSPDGEKFVVLVRSGPSRNEDVLVYDTRRGTPTRLTFSGSNWPAFWSPDGKRVVFGSNPTGVKNLYIVNADGNGEIERLTTSEYEQRPSSWSAEGNLIAFLEYRPSSSQIWVLPMDGERKPKLFLESRFALTYPEFSPDGHWIAYVSSESGRNELYVQPYPGPGEKYRVSTEGASEPIWVGRELLYRDGERFFSVTVTSLNPFRAEPPRLLFSSSYRNDGPVRGWDASRDGRFLLLKPEGSGVFPVNQLNVVLNWTEELKHRVPMK
jgi:Tol biopolymer transport system component